MPDLESPNPVPDAQPVPAETTVPRPDDFESLPESWQAEIKSLRKESADRRAKLSAFERAEEDRKQATLSDIEKAQKTAQSATERAAALESKLIQRDAYTALNSASIVDAELAFLAIRDKLIVENGEATNLSELVTELVKSKPHLVKVTNPVAPDTRPTSPTMTPTPAQKPLQIGRLFSSRNK